MAVKSALVNVMEKAARKAARGLLHDFGEVEQLQVSTKGPADFVTTADLKAEEVLVGELGRARPDFGFLVEERGEIPGADPAHRWLVDPLDGTTNFLHGIPHFCISIALERIEVSAGKTRREITAGLVFDPLRNELFWGEKGVGAFVRGLTETERVALIVRDELFAGSWESYRKDLEARAEGRPYVFKLASRIEDDLRAVEKLGRFERRHEVNLADYLGEGR